MKAWMALLLALIVLLQYKLWFSDVGKFAQRQLSRELAEQQERFATLAERNDALTAEALALKRDPGNLEARARRDLGMIRQGEVFYFVPEQDED